MHTFLDKKVFIVARTLAQMNRRLLKTKRNRPAAAKRRRSATNQPALAKLASTRPVA
jgi:hypothetical protein